MMQRFDAVVSILDRGDLEARDRLEELCRALGLPSYQLALEGQLKRAQNAVTAVRTRMKAAEPADPRNPDLMTAISIALKVDSHDLPHLHFGDVYQGLFLERSAVALEVLLRQPEASINPVFHSDGLPAPYVVFETDEGARRAVLRLPGQGDARIMMLVDKVLVDNNLACYRDGTEEEDARVSRASLGCPHFTQCFRTRKHDPLEFCMYPEWSGMAGGQYRVWQAVGPLMMERSS
jgi:hypothetical protein